MRTQQQAHTMYAVAFTDAKTGTPRKVLGFKDLFETAKAAKAEASRLVQQAIDKQNRNFGIKWGYAVVAVKAV